MDSMKDEAEILLDIDGRRERLEQVVRDLQSGKIRPIDHATARERIKTILDTLHTSPEELWL